MASKRKHSLAELKKTQHARRTLAAREERCERPVRREVERVLVVERMGFEDRSDLDVDEALKVLRKAKDLKIGEFAWWNKPTKNRDGEYTGFEENFFAAKRYDGTVAFGFCRAEQDPYGGDTAPCSPLAAWNWQDGAYAKRRAVASWAEHANGGAAYRCYCNDEEMVALDELIQAGVKKAGKLAIQCRKGGGVLEGTKRRRRKRK